MSRSAHKGSQLVKLRMATVTTNVIKTIFKLLDNRCMNDLRIAIKAWIRCGDHQLCLCVDKNWHAIDDANSFRRNRMYSYCNLFSIQVFIITVVIHLISYKLISKLYWSIQILNLTAFSKASFTRHLIYFGLSLGWQFN